MDLMSVLTYIGDCSSSSTGGAFAVSPLSPFFLPPLLYFFSSFHARTHEIYLLYFRLVLSEQMSRRVTPTVPVSGTSPSHPLTLSPHLPPSPFPSLSLRCIRSLSYLSTELDAVDASLYNNLNVSGFAFEVNLIKGPFYKYFHLSLSSLSPFPFLALLLLSPSPLYPLLPF